MTPDQYKLDCSVARALETVGERWSLLIVRDAFYGVRRFEDFQHDLGIARNILTDRLKRLVDQEVLERTQYGERPPRFEYKLTEKGKDLLPVMLTMMRWGDKWFPGEMGPPVQFTHTCGNVTTPTLVCDHCGEELKRRDLRADPEPVRVRTRISGISV
jgi:DNA-binding HxlR family transcriptional regulator